MRYSDTELFDMTEDELNALKSELTFDEFCEFAISELNMLVGASLDGLNWMDQNVKHLRNYRIKAVKFYEEKRGKSSS